MDNVAIIGAGPYGLSIAAHLADAGVPFRIFGSPMRTWRETMPSGMQLKSEGFASSLSDPRRELPLSRYCADHGIGYADIGTPVALGTFVDYGRAFQQRFAPMLEDSQVMALASAGDGFEITLDDGRTARFRRVVMAVGIAHYARMAPTLASLPAALASHSSARSDYRAFAGRSVAVVGGGASAVDCAVELAAAGARTLLLTRRRALRFHKPPRRRTLAERIRAPFTPIGPSWRSVAFTRAPLLLHAMPAKLRERLTRRFLGPAAGWVTRERFDAGVELRAAADIVAAAERNGRVLLTIDQANERHALEVDHVVAATGYGVDLARLPFLVPALRERVRVAAGAPVLSRDFQTSVPGLYFVGTAAANAFGPLLRFACGAEFTARRLSRHLARAQRRLARTSASGAAPDAPRRPA